MKQVTKILAILLLSGLFFAPLSPILSATTSTDFNPNYLISDAEMQDPTCMNQTDVQSFLTQYNSALANMLLPDKDGVLKKPSEIIFNAAKEHKISPKYLLVKLQKEQSLITETNPRQSQLDGATGYGITDGCGWNCAMYLNNQGFGKQVDSAAGIIRWYYDNKNANDWIKKAGISYLIDGTTIVPANDATAFLYTYTPHLHGNLNFWNLWQNWFGYSIPDGSLVKSADSPAIYLLQDGKKRLIKSMSILASRFNQEAVLNVPSAEIAIYPEGAPISFSNYSILKNGSNYHLVDFDTIRPFASFQVVQKIGYNPEEFVEVTGADLIGYKIGATIQLDNTNPAGRLVKVKEADNALYYLKDGFYQPVYNAVLAKATFPSLKIEPATIKDLQNHQPGALVKFPDGTLISEITSNNVYVLEKGKKRLIPDNNVFNGFGYKRENIIKVDNMLASIHETGATVYLPARLLALSNQDVTTTSDGVNDSQSGETVIENGKMVAVSEAKSVYVGKKFTTNVNTYLVADYATGEILAGKNIDTARPLASFTKVMTAYQLMYDGLKLFGQTTFDNKQKSKYHSFRTAPGEVFNNQDLFEALLISSINTPAKMLVSSVEKTESKFIARMNAKAKEWGLKNTKFVDTDGCDTKNVTIAREYLKLYTNAEKIKEVRETLAMKQYSYDEIKDLDGKPKHYDVHTNLLANKPGLPFKIISSKTGYLDEAGAGLVMLIERPSDKKKFIVITMGNPDYTHRFVEPERLANWSLTNF